MPRVEIKDLANAFGTGVIDIRKNCYDIIASTNLTYSIIDGYKREQLILDILKRVDRDRQVIGAPSRQKIWHDGWKENLQDFIKSKYDLNKLIPRFIRPKQPIRYNLQYIKPVNPNFELDFYSIFRLWLFKKYLKDFAHIYEFGCGTGFNLVALAQLYPDKKLFGLDFVKSSTTLVNEIAKRYGYNIKGKLFNMFSPDKKCCLEKDSAVFTVGSVEQLASKFEPFIKYLLHQPVSLYIHVEPMIELYDENKLIDYLAIKFQGKRGYTKTFLPYLRQLESRNIIEILKVKRLFFGSLFMEGYNYIVWRKVNK